MIDFETKLSNVQFIKISNNNSIPLKYSIIIEWMFDLFYENLSIHSFFIENNNKNNNKNELLLIINNNNIIICNQNNIISSKNIIFSKKNNKNEIILDFIILETFFIEILFKIQLKLLIFTNYNKYLIEIILINNEITIINNNNPILLNNLNEKQSFLPQINAIFSLFHSKNHFFSFHSEFGIELLKLMCNNSNNLIENNDLKLLDTQISKVRNFKQIINQNYNNLTGKLYITIICLSVCLSVCFDWDTSGCSYV